MKKYGYWIALLALIAFNLYVFFPVSPETALERNVRWSGENGKELERVLEHYRRTGEEQKERCARYLIIHMDRRAAITYEGIVQEKRNHHPRPACHPRGLPDREHRPGFRGVEEIPLVQPPDGAGVLPADSALPNEERTVGGLAEILLPQV